MSRSARIALPALVLGLASAPALAAPGPQPAWLDQFGTIGFDAVDDVAADDSLAYAAGRVGADQALPGQSSAGRTDAFVRAYEADGTVVWTRQFGTAGSDVFPVASPTASGVVVAGGTTGTFAGQTSAGSVDVFVRHFAADGTEQSTAQFGTAGFDGALGVAEGPSGTYVLGFTDGAFPGQTPLGGLDLFLARLDQDGELLWVRQFGTPGDDPARFTLGGLAVDQTGIYVGSSVPQALPDASGAGGPDAFVRRYDHQGTVLWTRQFGTPCTDLLTDLDLHDGSLYLGGLTLGDLASGGTGATGAARCRQAPTPYNDVGGRFDTWVQRAGDDGGPVWTTQYGGRAAGTLGFTLAIGLAVDHNGIVVAGEAVRPRTGGVGDQSREHQCPTDGHAEDIMVQRLGLDGTLGSTTTVGTTGRDVPSGVALLDGVAIVGGSTDCALEGSSAGSADAFVLGLD